MRRIALVNQKGGCGKTTIAVNLSSCLAAAGKKVLLIDLDPQGHSALGLGIKPDRIEKSIYEVMLGDIPVREAILNLRENFNIICSDVVLSAFEQLMAGVPGREYKLTQSLKTIQNEYDFQIIDCPPSVGLLTINGLMASSEVIIPVDPSCFSLDGVDKLLDTIRVIADKTGHKLLTKILPTNVDRRTRFCKEIVENLRNRFTGRYFHTVINTCTALREAAGKGRPLIEYNKHCIACRDFKSLTQEVLSMGQKKAVEMGDVDFLMAPENGAMDRDKRGFAFTLVAPEHKSVQIAGDFNDWVPEALDFRKTQGQEVWHKEIPLKPGGYAYKYIIDGRWIPDPANNEGVDDRCGGRNSIINIKPLK
jgi:chromosome partitioning protein